MTHINYELYFHIYSETKRFYCPFSVATAIDSASVCQAVM